MSFVRGGAFCGFTRSLQVNAALGAGGETEPHKIIDFRLIILHKHLFATKHFQLGRSSVACTFELGRMFENWKAEFRISL